MTAMNRISPGNRAASSHSRGGTSISAAHRRDADGADAVGDSLAPLSAGAREAILSGESKGKSFPGLSINRRETGKLDNLQRAAPDSLPSPTVIWGKKIDGIEYSTPTFSPDGTRLASAGAFEGFIHVFNAKNGEMVWWKKLGSTIISSPHFSPDGYRLSVSSLEKSVLWLDASTASEYWSAKLGNDAFSSPAISPDGSKDPLVERDPKRSGILPCFFSRWISCGVRQPRFQSLCGGYRKRKRGLAPDHKRGGRIFSRFFILRIAPGGREQRRPHLSLQRLRQADLEEKNR